MPYRSQSANRLTEHIHAAVRAAVGDTARVLLVACSGGADSTCLAHAITAVARREGWTVSLGHVRHGVRAEDAGDLDRVRALAERLGVAADHETLAPSSRASEASLRTGRYLALARMARSVGAHAVLTGHTMNDQSETILLHLIRGSGLDGLVGMRVCSAYPVDDDRRSADAGAPENLRLIRPLLAIRREETEEYCAAHSLAFGHDITNDDQVWRRNWLRHTVLPEIRSRYPDITGTLAQAASLLAEDARFLDEETDRALARCKERCEADVSILDRRAFANEPPALRLRIVRRLFARYGGDVPRADLVIRAVHTLSSTQSSRMVHFGRVACSIVLGNMIVGAPDDVLAWILRDAGGRFPLDRGRRPIAVDVPISLGGPPGMSARYLITIRSVHAKSSIGPSAVVQTHALALPDGAYLTMRNYRPGDRFHPLGGDHSIALGEYLSRRGVAAPVRDWLPLLIVNDTIAWVIGHGFGARFTSSGDHATHVASLLRDDA